MTPTKRGRHYGLVSHSKRNAGERGMSIESSMNLEFIWKNR
jgi:hypothetical protein